jgi:hypothetical protein
MRRSEKCRIIWPKPRRFAVEAVHGDEVVAIGQDGIGILWRGVSLPAPPQPIPTTGSGQKYISTLIEITLDAPPIFQ